MLFYATFARRKWTVEDKSHIVFLQIQNLAIVICLPVYRMNLHNYFKTTFCSQLAFLVFSVPSS